MVLMILVPNNMKAIYSLRRKVKKQLIITVRVCAKLLNLPFQISLSLCSALWDIQTSVY